MSLFLAHGTANGKLGSGSAHGDIHQTDSIAQDLDFIQRKASGFQQREAGSREAVACAAMEQGARLPRIP